MRKFLICEHCGNIVGTIKDTGVPIICCGEPMKAMQPNTVDASKEKHVPVVTKDGENITVTIGSVLHPSTEEHYIQWIALSQGDLMQRVTLDPTKKPSITFKGGTGSGTAYAYCNLHGLWATEF